MYHAITDCSIEVDSNWCEYIKMTSWRHGTWIFHAQLKNKNKKSWAATSKLDTVLKSPLAPSGH